MSKENPEFFEQKMGESLWVERKDWNSYRDSLLANRIPRGTGNIWTKIMFGALIYREHEQQPHRSVLEQLRESPDLIEHDIPNLFIAAENQDTGSYTEHDSKHSWKDALIALVSDGTLEKKFILDGCFHVIGFPLSDYQLRWFVQLLERVSLDERELEAESGRFLDLVNHPRSTPRNLGFKFFEQQFKKGRIPSEQVPEYAKVFLREPAKGKAIKGLGFLEKTLKKSPKLTDSILDAAVDALEHESADVQEAGAKLLSGFSNEIPQTLRTRIETALEITSASVRKMLPEFSPKTEKVREKVFSISSVSKSTKTLEPLVPVKDVEELIDATLRYIESQKDIDELERIIEGIIRLYQERNDDFEKKTGPVRKNHNKLISWPVQSMVRYWFRKREFDKNGDEILDENDKFFLEYESEKMPKKLEYVDPDSYTFYRKVDFVLRMIRSEPCVTIALPSHKPCLIDPLIFVERLDKSRKTFEICGKYDKLLALLRLGDWNRPEALERLESMEIQPELGSDFIEYLEALKYALGGTNIEFGSDAPLWNVALFVRNPDTPEPEFLRKFPDTASVPMYTPEEYGLIDLANGKNNDPDHYSATYVFPMQIPQKTFARERKYLKILVRTEMWSQASYLDSISDIYSSASSRVRKFYYTAGIIAANRLDLKTWIKEAILPLELLMRRNDPIGCEGAFLILASLGIPSPDISGFAAEALADAIEYSRTNIQETVFAAKDLLKFLHITDAKKNLLKPKRWIAPLRTVAEHSDECGRFVWKFLDAIFPDLPEREQLPYMELMHGLSLENDKYELSSETMSVLKSIKPTGKSGKLAKQILDKQILDKQILDK